MTPEKARSLFKVLASVAAALAVQSSSSFGQTPTPSQTLTRAEEEVFVIKEPIPISESEYVHRVTVLATELMEKQGANTPIEGLRLLPSFVGTTRTENDSTGGDGRAFINRYALGSSNVLSLVNGRRAFSFSDINAIPIAGLSRAEIFESNAYGSDSTAGVVNFVMLNGPDDKPYGGAELHVLYGNTTDADAHVRQVYVKGGVSGPKVSIAAAGEYYSRAHLFSRDREISSSADRSNNPTGLGWGGIDNNSPTYAGRISVSPGASALGFGTTGQLVLSDLTNGQVTPGSYRSFEGAGTDGPGTDPSRFNFRNFSPSIPAVENAMYYVTGRYKIFGDDLQLYGDVMYSHTKQDNGMAGSPVIINVSENGLGEARASIFNPAGNFLTSLNYRLQQELGDRRSFYDSDYQRYVIGANGDFNFKESDVVSHIGYDSGFVYEDYSQQRTDSGDTLRSGIRSLIGDNVFNPFIGQFAPLTGFAPSYVNGVPTGKTAFYDNRSAAALAQNGGAAYIGHSLSYERDWLADARVNAHFFPNLWNGGFYFAFVGEHRESRTSQVPDSVQASGDQLGFTALLNTRYQQEVTSFYGYFLVPIVTSMMNVRGVRSLDFYENFRFEQYDDRDQLTGSTATFDSGVTPDLGLRYQPFQDLMVRVSWKQSIRPPTFNELFAPVVQTFPIASGPLPPIQPSIGMWIGGNPTLTPEKTDTYSAGIVWSPKSIPGFTLTADWYQYYTRDLILNGNLFWPLAVAENSAKGGTAFVDPDGCGRSGSRGAPGGPGVGITRDVFGDLLCIDSLNSNSGKRLVQGVETTMNYEIPTENFGTLNFSGGYNHFFTWKIEPLAGTGAHSFLGSYNNGSLAFGPGAVPWNKGYLRGEWEWNGFDFVATGNYISDFWDDPTAILGNTLIGGTDVNPEWALHRQVTSYTTLDLQLSYEWRRPESSLPYTKDAKDGKNVMSTSIDTSSIWQRMLWGSKITIGVNNVFDRNPPSVLAAPNDNYDTSLYSIRNRYYYIAFDKKF